MKKIMGVALTNLEDYNNGRLVYKWLELPASEEDIKDAIGDIVPNGEEFFISDYEIDIEGVKIHEYDDVYKLNELAKKLNLLNTYDLKAIESIIEYEGCGLERALEIYNSGDDIFYSDVESFEELAEILVDDGLFGEIPEHLINYIDYKKIGEDLKNDYSQTKNGMLRMY